MPSCNICKLGSSIKYANTPYWMCGNCTLWFQEPKPSKIYEADHEKDSHGNFTGHLMSENDKQVNKNLANFLSNQFTANKGKSLDIGSKYPYLSHCLKNLGFEAYGMDNIEIVPDYSKELDVPILMMDFESVIAPDILDCIGFSKFDLITLVHVFEHMYDPIEALKKLRQLISNDGILFIRLPDHSVSGFERDLTKGHYSIHPYYHTLESILEILVQTENLFKVINTYPINGAGQRDIILAPINKKPIVYAGMIVKNEERDLPRCLKSIESVIDGAVIIDTGSIDKTKEVVLETLFPGFPAPSDKQNKGLVYRTYLEASENINDDWKLFDFSKARNEFVKEIDGIADFCFWVDADDELINPNELKRAIYLDQYKVFGVYIDDSSTKFIHHRLWKTKLGIVFEGKCHEYPTILSFPATILENVVIKHDATPNGVETSNERNLRILEKEVLENPTNLRTLFYLANTHKDGERYNEAIPYYTFRITNGIGYRDEWLFAYLYKARCERAAGKNEDAKRTLLEACSKEPGWSEFWMELAYIELDAGKNLDAIGFCLQAFGKPIFPTSLWREPNKYTDQPARIISHAYNNLGEKEHALEWAEKAKILIGQKDDDWDNFINRLVVSKIAICRPGAIGDILMILNLIPYVKEKYPDHEIHFYCNEEIGAALCDIMAVAGVDEIKNSDNINYQLLTSSYKHWFNIVGYPLNEGYPNTPMKKHLIDYFADELGISSFGRLVLPKPEKPLEIEAYRYATLQVKAGWSKYKEWSIEKWEELISFCPDIIFYQIGSDDHPKVRGANHSLIGKNLTIAIAAIANSDLHVGLDSFANHVTNFNFKDKEGKVTQPRAVILWGSTQVLASGYKHNTNISLGLPCQPCFKEDPTISKMSNGVCHNPPNQSYENPKHQCMSDISVEIVLKEIQKMWNNKSTKHHLISIQ